MSSTTQKQFTLQLGFRRAISVNTVHVLNPSRTVRKRGERKCRILGLWRREGENVKGIEGRSDDAIDGMEGISLFLVLQKDKMVSYLWTQSGWLSTPILYT